MHHIMQVLVRNRYAEYTGREQYICGNSGYFIHFDFDPEWTSYNVKTARFVTDNGTYDVLFEGNEFEMPILSDTHHIRVGVYAGNLRTTTSAYIPAKKSILCESGTPAEPPEDIYAQIMEKVNEAVDTAKDVENRANAGEFNGKDGQPGKDAAAEAYELIEECTLTETAWFTRNSEPNWTPYNFKRFLLVMETDGMAMGTNMQVRSGSEIIAQSWLYDKDNSDGSKHLSAFLKIDIENGAMYVQAANTWLEGTSANLVNGITRYVGDKTVTSVGFSAMMPAGMTVRIWGVRA